MVTLTDLKEALTETLRAELRTELRETADLHASFQWEKFLREGVDAHFNARIQDTTRSEQYEPDPSTYWTQDSYVGPLFAGKVSNPGGTISSVSIYTKRVFNYGNVMARTTLPDLSGMPNLSAVYFGFEGGSQVGTGIACFRYNILGGVEGLAVMIGGGGQSHELGITLPTDHKTTQHTYRVSVGKNLVEFYIDDALVALGIATGAITPRQAIAPPRYGIIITSWAPIAPSLTAFAEVTGHGAALDLDLSPYWFRVSDGDPRMPKVYRLYESGTNDLLAGMSVDPSVTSHPFPLIGYAGKTIHLQADGAGTMDVQVLMETGNWRTYDSVAIAANTLESYNFAGEALLGRILFTPTAAPANIDDAEVVLR